MRTFLGIAGLCLALASCTTHPAPSLEANAPPAATATTDASAGANLAVRFDAAAGELPEGLAVTKDAAFIGLAPSGRVMRVELSTLTAAAWGKLPAPVPGKGFMTGLARAQTGEIYAGLASFVPEVQAGIYRIPAQGGDATLFAKDAALPFPNGVALDADGTLFVSDSSTGTIFHIDQAGRSQAWASGDALLGDKDGCNGAGPGFAIGANGVAVEPNALYVVNLDKATLLKIPRDAAGHAGAPQVIAGPDCATLGGADGLALAPDDSFVIAVNRQDKLVRVARDGTIGIVSSGPPLDFPASVAYVGSTLYATNFAFKNASANKPALPGLLRIAP